MDLRGHRSYDRARAGAAAGTTLAANPTGTAPAEGSRFQVNEETLLVDQHARIRDVRVTPAGVVYVLTDSGKLLKLMPK